MVAACISSRTCPQKGKTSRIRVGFQVQVCVFLLPRRAWGPGQSSSSVRFGVLGFGVLIGVVCVRYREAGLYSKDFEYTCTFKCLI